MVATTADYNFAVVVDEFLDLKDFPNPNGPSLRAQIRTRALEIFAHPDVRYMPAFKILDLVAELVNAAGEIAAEHQLRANEATALLSAHSSDTTPLVQQFLLDAALERARYEPMMLEANGNDARAYRNLILTKRWQAMLHAHQSLTALPADWVAVVTTTVDQAMHAPVFARYRTGPLLQLFAEMLQRARQLHESAAPIIQLTEHIGAQSALWKRYALKAARYEHKPGHEPAAPNRVLAPTTTGPHAIH
jgi:hypothetical protein